MNISYKGCCRSSCFHTSVFLGPGWDLGAVEGWFWSIGWSLSGLFLAGWVEWGWFAVGSLCASLILGIDDTSGG